MDEMKATICTRERGGSYFSCGLMNWWPGEILNNEELKEQHLQSEEIPVEDMGLILTTGWLSKKRNCKKRMKLVKYWIFKDVKQTRLTEKVRMKENEQQREIKATNVRDKKAQHEKKMLQFNLHKQDSAFQICLGKILTLFCQFLRELLKGGTKVWTIHQTQPKFD